MKTQVKNGSSFDAMKEGFSNSNKVAKEVIAEHKDAATPVTNSTGVAKRIAKRMTSAGAGSASTKTPKTIYQTGINTTTENARKVNKALDTFVPVYVSPIPALALPALDAMYGECKRLVKEVSDLEGKDTVDRNMRGGLYKGINSYGAQIVNQLKACGADKTTVMNARKCVMKMEGVRIIPINRNIVGAKHISASHTGFEDKLAFYGELIEVASNYEGYDVVTGPNSVTAMHARYDAMDAANDAADASYAAVAAARRARNAFFNTDITGLVDTYQRVKSNVKAGYGTTSAEYKAISGLAFTRIQE